MSADNREAALKALQKNRKAVDLMDGREAAKYIKVFSYWTLLELAKRGQCPHIRVGKRVFFRKDSLDKWLDDLETGGTAPQMVEGSQYGKLRKIYG